MPDHGRPSPLRILAPLALGVVAVAFVAIVLTSGSSDGESAKTGKQATRTTTERQRETTSTAPRSRSASTYTVKVGDTLGGIAEETGVPVERLLELNPDLDPQALVSGQKIKLRE